MVGDGDVNVPLLRQAFRYLLEVGARIDLIGDDEVPDDFAESLQGA